MIKIHLVSEVKGFYETPHRLRKMFAKDEEVTVKEPGRGHLSGGFFFLLGGVTGNFKEGTETKCTTTYVKFAWEIKDNTYVISTLPLEKVRIKVVDQVESPMVSFFLDEFEVNKSFNDQKSGFKTYNEGKKSVDQNLRRILNDYYNPHEALRMYLAYATFTVKDGDWPSNINLPLAD